MGWHIKEPSSTSVVPLLLSSSNQDSGQQVQADFPALVKHRPAVHLEEKEIYIYMNTTCTSDNRKQNTKTIPLEGEIFL